MGPFFIERRCEKHGALTKPSRLNDIRMGVAAKEDGPVWGHFLERHVAQMFVAMSMKAGMSSPKPTVRSSSSSR